MTAPRQQEGDSLILQRSQQFTALSRLLFSTLVPSDSGPETPEQILQTHARTSFSFAAHFLPEQKRHGATILYAFFRTVDDLVDERRIGADGERVANALLAWRSWLTSDRRRTAPCEPLGAELASVIDEYSIPTGIFLDLLDGLEADLEPRRIRDEQELETYCYQVASTVGIAMAHVLGCTSEAGLRAASRLGAAMQLTNILRDIGEDLEAGRVYLPATALEQAGIDFDDLVLMQRGIAPVDARFRWVMREHIAKAQNLYNDGIDGIWLLPDECRLPILLASRLYRRLLDIIADHDYDTLRNRVGTSRFDKLQEAFICYAMVTLGSQQPASGADVASSCERSDASARRR